MMEAQAAKSTQAVSKIRSCEERLAKFYSLYDPLGLLSPITIKYKLLLQQLVQTGIGWDEPLPADVQKTAKSVL